MLCPVTMHKAIRYAIALNTLTEDIKTFFLKNWGCVRKVYNLYVDLYHCALDKAGYTGGHDIPKVSLPEVTSFKKEYDYLKEADSLALANAKLNFEQAVSHYREDCDHKTYTKRALRQDRSGTKKLSFRGLKGMPGFHSRAHGYFSYTTNCQYPKESNKLKQPTICLEKDMLYLPKLKAGVRLPLYLAGVPV